MPAPSGDIYELESYALGGIDAMTATWLNGGVPPTQVAEWAGRSVEVLLRTARHGRT
ncbi:hypothetical protein [Salinispora cortesiana]|uniref:hypothetical protein n=1 Tax=Salinispora cortesiana TaxID=1305843 RepID=UPI0012BCCA43|nr:hypothetical protein [Salinispora cortesiana]